MRTDARPIRRPTRSGLKVLAVGLLLLCVALPVLYVASVGPAAKMAIDGRIDFDLFLGFYVPIRWVTDRNSTANRGLAWYLDACGASLCYLDAEDGRPVGVFWDYWD